MPSAMTSQGPGRATFWQHSRSKSGRSRTTTAAVGTLSHVNVSYFSGFTVSAGAHLRNDRRHEGADARRDAGGAVATARNRAAIRRTVRTGRCAGADPAWPAAD